MSLGLSRAPRSLQYWHDLQRPTHIHAVGDAVYAQVQKYTLQCSQYTCSHHISPLNVIVFFSAVYSTNSLPNDKTGGLMGYGGF